MSDDVVGRLREALADEREVWGIGFDGDERRDANADTDAAIDAVEAALREAEAARKWGAEEMRAASQSCDDLRAGVRRLNAEVERLRRDANLDARVITQDAADVARLEAEVERLKAELQLVTAPVEAGGGVEAHLRAEVERLRRELADERSKASQFTG